jgi:hypothetical protein
MTTPIVAWYSEIEFGFLEIRIHNIITWRTPYIDSQVSLVFVPASITVEPKQCFKNSSIVLGPRSYCVKMGCSGIIVMIACVSDDT